MGQLCQPEYDTTPLNLNSWLTNFVSCRICGLCPILPPLHTQNKLCLDELSIPLLPIMVITDQGSNLKITDLKLKHFNSFHPKPWFHPVESSQFITLFQILLEKGHRKKRCFLVEFCVLHGVHHQKTPQQHSSVDNRFWITNHPRRHSVHENVS